METESRAPRIDELLGHLGWVRALAGRLVADAASADDLVQQTWLAALERPPRHGSNPRGWLARVLKNQLRQGSRAARRRGERALAPQSADGTPEFRDHVTPAQLAEEADVQRHLVGLVGELEEPLRSTLLLRYARGWNSARIASHQGVPAGTVRWRLSQGLARLRDRLDTTHAGDRRAWALAFIPWAQAPAGSSAGQAAGWLAALPGWITMKLVSSLTLAAVAAVLAFNSIDLGVVQPTIVARTGAAEEPTAIDATGDTEPSRNPHSVASFPTMEDVARVVGELGGTARRDRTATHAFASVHFVDSAGEPVGDVEVLDGFGERLLGSPAGIFSDEWGQARLPLGRLGGTPGPAAGTGVQRSKWIAVHPKHRMKSFSVEAADVPEVDGGTIELEPGTRLSGQLMDPNGAPVTGGWIEVEERLTQDSVEEHRLLQRSLAGPQGISTTTDDGGYFRFVGAPTGDLRVWAGHVGWVARVVDVTGLRAGESVDLGVLSLEAHHQDRTLRGRVFDPDGAPAPHVDVSGIQSTERGPRSEVVVSNKKGEFQFISLEQGPWELFVAPTKRSPVTARMSNVPMGSSDLELRLVPSEQVRITVVDREGAPIESANVDLLDAVHGGSVARVWSNDEKNDEWLAHVPSMPFIVQVTSPTHARGRAGPFEPTSAPAKVRLELAPARGIRGTVATTSGSTIEGEVLVHRAAKYETYCRGFPTRLDLHPFTRATLEPDGSFHAAVHEAGDYALIIKIPGFAALEVDARIREASEGIDLGSITPMRGGVLEGTLLRGPGEAVAERVVALSRGDSHPIDTLTDEEGRFRFEGLTPGPWLVELRARRLEARRTPGSSIDAPPHRKFPTSCVVRDGLTTRFDLDYRSSSRTSLCLVEGVLDAPERLAPWSIGVFPLARPHPTPSGGTIDEIGDDGRFLFSSSLPGRHPIHLQSLGALRAEPPFGLSLLRDLAVDPGTNQVSLDLRLGALEIRGRALPWIERIEVIGDLGDGWVAHVNLSIAQDPTSFHLASCPSIPVGKYGIDLGDLDGSASGSTEDPRRIEFEIREGDTTVVELP